MFGSSKRGIAAALLAAAMLLCGCSTKVRTYDCEVGPDAIAIWECNRQIIVRAVKGKKFTIRQLDRAATFFEDLTGIPADLKRTEFGPLPGNELRTNLEAWDAWYREHGDRLKLTADGTLQLEP
jgi:hypothetical protein